MKKLFKSSSLILSTFLTLSLLASTPGEPKPVKSSSVSWTASKVTRTHSGIITLGDSHLEMDGDRIVGGRIEVDMSTIVVTDLEGEYKAKLEGHLKSDDFFGVAQNPTASLDITGSTPNDDGSQQVTGNITIKGETQPITFTMSIKGNYVTTALNIDRTKFGIRYGSGSFFDDLGDKAINDMFEIRAKLEL
ncbi:MAG TPA: YceI family protein [Flavobacteriaceae bacterium]|jgi:polyisoprenoid-binding protein YceI|nr:YceI family protein [Flavobacteriaceae bacterium]